jgi:hypothetical protein
MKERDIVTVMTATGEYVGRLLVHPLRATLKMDETAIILENPRMITFAEQGMGFANGIAATGIQDPKEMVILQAIFVTETNPEVIKAWHQATSGLLVP